MKKSLLTAFCALAAFAAVTSCNKNQTYSPSDDFPSYKGEPGMTKTLVKIQGSSQNENVNRSQVFAYDSNGLLVSYGNSSAGFVTTILMPCSELTIYVLANAFVPPQNAQTETDFLKNTLKLTDCNHPSMGQPFIGKTTYTITENAEIPIELHHHTAKIFIKNVKKQFKNGGDTRKFSVSRVYLANAAASVMVTREADPNAEHLFTNGPTDQGSNYYAYLAKDITYLSNLENGVTKDASISLYTFPTDSCAVVFDCLIGLDHRYYTVNLPANLKSSQLVEISNVTFTKQGAETPGGDIPNDGIISFTILLQNWEKDTTIEWNESVSF